jgi:TonB-linked SusC/RagA family outer membrane protein
VSSSVVRSLPRTLVPLVTALALAGAFTALRPVLPAASLLAQEAGTIAGTVNAAGTQEPLVGAQIAVVGGTQRAQSDERGHFRLTGLSGNTGALVTIEVRRIGYREQRVAARLGDVNLAVQLSVNPTSLEAVVVTGTVGATEKRALGNSVAQINASDVVQTAPIVSMQSLLNGRAPGLVVLPTSGEVGSGSQVRVRGLASFSLSNNPLLYVDGVRVDNAAATGPANQSFGSSSISRLNDVNPEDIESIEVLKGPSAATLYGTEASNGVINIITKKGAGGGTRWNLVARQGVNYLQDWRTRFPTNYGIINGGPQAGQVGTVSMDSLIAGNQGQDIFRNGRHQETELSVSGGIDRLNYYASGNLLDSQGAEVNNNTRKYSGRLNLNLAPTDKVHISTNVGYVTGPTYLSPQAGFGGHVWTTLLATPNNYNKATRHGFHSLLPYQYDQVYKQWQDLDRLTASVRFEHTPVSWFTHRFTAGTDRTRENDNAFQPRIDSLVYTVGSDALGYRDDVEREVAYRTLDYAATATWNFRPTIRFQTSAGAQYYYNGTSVVEAFGSVFPTPGLTSVLATTQSKGQTQDFAEDKTLGIYGQEAISWRDRLFATVALRSDDNSAFGANFSRVTYPKYSLSYVISEEPWFHLLGDRLTSLRLRAAYGEAGKAPSTYSALRTYTAASGPGDSPAVTPQFIGNPNLGPERGKEIEAGFDANAFQDRIGLEFTYYNKKTVDAILNRDIAPSIGFASQEPFNAGAIRNTGIEASLRATAWHSDRLTWDIGLSYASNANTVLDLGIPGQSFVSAGTYVQQHVGYPAFSWFEKRVVGAKLGATGTVIPGSVMCADTVPGSGGRESSTATRLCAGADGRYGTPDDAPLVYLGRSTPPREGSISTSLTLLGRWHLSTMVDIKNGEKKLDGNTRVRCGIFGRCLLNFVPTDAKTNRDTLDVASMQSNSNLVDFFISNASFAKWRELTLSYDLPARFLHPSNVTRASLSVSGRNLHTWTSYKGFEPEAMFLGGTRGGNIAWEQTTLPQLTSWIVTLNLGF